MPSENKENKLFIVGLGPGAREKMTLQALKVLREVDAIVGYRPYLEMISDLLAGKMVESSSMGKEVDRVKAAVDRLDEGSVALVSSGDPNIYGMAGLGLEMASDAARVEVVPGVTSFTTAACRAGIAFRDAVAVISLSDLLTPWSEIEARLKLAGEINLPVAIYNPKSRRRDWQVKRALEILGPDKDTLVARNVARPGEETTWTKARDLLEDQGPELDMFTLLIVSGNGMTRAQTFHDAVINIVGIGPGGHEWLTLEAEDALRSSAKIFGAGRYLESVKDVIDGEAVAHPGTYEERMAARIEDARTSADQGEKVSLLTGGDPSIFSSAHRYLRSGMKARICPGISAFSAMAAKAGAPLVNDFVLTSETDASRIERLAGAGFGVVIYNIEGSRLQPILEILDTSRPCVLARDVSREGEVIMAMTASDMKEAHPNGHRFTLLVASKNSYIKSGRVVTKRGYEVKYNY